MNEIDAKLHERIHKHMMEADSDSIFKDRVTTFATIEKQLGTRVAGNVLDIGCGNGYASIWLAKNRQGVKVTALEASTAAVAELIPKHIAHHSVEGVVTPRVGSFDNIGQEGTYDYVIAFGAIHHSACLFSTMKSIARALKEGGYLVANEPVMPNATSNDEYIRKYDVVQDMFGLKIRNGDRHDHFFREAEYITAAAFAGLDLVFLDDFHGRGAKGLMNRVSGSLSDAGLGKPLSHAVKKLRAFRGDAKTLSEDDLLYRRLTSNVRAKIMLFRKSNHPYIPHLWKGLE